MPYFAHTNDTPDQSQWELLGDHLKKAADYAAKIGDKFGSRKWAYLLGLWHDIGKYHWRFQKKIRGEWNNQPHAPAGAYLAFTRGQEVSMKMAYTLAQVIGGHHSGLHDRLDLNDLLGNGREDWPEVVSRMPDNVREHPLPDLPDWLDPDDPVSLDLWTRFLFSALIDADRIMTEHYASPYVSIQRRDTKREQTALRDLISDFEAHLLKIEKDCFDSGDAGNPINILRHLVSQECLTAAYGDQGAYSCTVPTGGGKTLSIMRFALHHALRHDLERIIVVIPYTSIIEQNADVYTRALGIDNVLEHHSNVDMEKKQFMLDEARKKVGNKTKRLSYFANENWDIPVVVTTNVQFFESLFSRKTSRCRKIHNIARSVIIFDEVQLFPRDFVSPIISVIKKLIDEYHCTAVFSTATQPAFDDRFIKDRFGNGAGIQATEIIPVPKDLAEKLRRARVHWPIKSDPVTWETIAKRIFKSGRESLTIVNLREDARELAETMMSMRPNTRVFHLSAIMCPAHRRKMIQEIKDILQRNKEKKRRGEKNIESCRVVSTQLIEAGVDIDFPHVFRAMIGLDSIAQAAGRCNREGLLPVGHLHIFYPPTDPPPGILRDGLAITRDLFMVHGRSLDPTDPVTQSMYFEELYRDNDLDKHYIRLKRERRDFKQIHEDFRIIPDETFIVFIPWGEKGESLLLDLLNATELKKSHLRAMQPYTVSVYKKTLDALREAGSIRQLVVDEEEKTIWYVEDMSIYDRNFGLRF